MGHSGCWRPPVAGRHCQWEFYPTPRLDKWRVSPLHPPRPLTSWCSSACSAAASAFAPSGACPPPPPSPLPSALPASSALCRCSSLPASCHSSAEPLPGRSCSSRWRAEPSADGGFTTPLMCVSASTTRGCSPPSALMAACAASPSSECLGMQICSSRGCGGGGVGVQGSGFRGWRQEGCRSAPAGTGTKHSAVVLFVCVCVCLRLPLCQSCCHCPVPGLSCSKLAV